MAAVAAEDSDQGSTGPPKRNSERTAPPARNDGRTGTTGAPHHRPGTSSAPARLARRHVEGPLQEPNLQRQELLRHHLLGGHVGDPGEG